MDETNAEVPDSVDPDVQEASHRMPPGSSVMLTTRARLAGHLREYGEEDLARRIPGLSAETMIRIGAHAFDVGPGQRMMNVKRLTLAAVEILEGAPRPLRRQRRKLR